MDIIFDIDGTIANLSHRRHFVRTKPSNWKAFNHGMIADDPITPVIEILKSLDSAGHTIILASGRGSEFREHTKKWLLKHDIPFNKLYMRKEGDFRKDDIVKKELYQQMLDDGYKPFAVFDDRKQVKRMWVNEVGLFVFDVNQTDDEF